MRPPHHVLGHLMAWPMDIWSFLLPCTCPLGILMAGDKGLLTTEKTLPLGHLVLGGAGVLQDWLKWGDTRRSLFTLKIDKCDKFKGFFEWY